MPKEGNILIVDDNKELLLALKLYLQLHFNTIKTEHNPNRIPERLQNGNYDIVMLDMNFTAGINNGNEGLYWMRQIKQLNPDLSIVFITGYSDVELAVKAIKEGAADFIDKSWDERKILSTLTAVYQLQKSKLTIRGLKKNKNTYLNAFSHATYLLANPRQCNR